MREKLKDVDQFWKLHGNHVEKQKCANRVVGSKLQNSQMWHSFFSKFCEHSKKIETEKIKNVLTLPVRPRRTGVSKASVGLLRQLLLGREVLILFAFSTAVGSAAASDDTSRAALCSAAHILSATASRVLCRFVWVAKEVLRLNEAPLHGKGGRTVFGP